MDLLWICWQNENEKNGLVLTYQNFLRVLLTGGQTLIQFNNIETKCNLQAVDAHILAKQA